MNPTILNSTLNDIDSIFNLYDSAVAHQKTVFHKHWQGFERSLIETEIAEHRQWKIIVGNDIACIFAVTYNDASIWRERDLEPSVYIHRIVTHPAFRGRAFVRDIIAWAHIFCQENDKRFIRMDTWADNPKLIEYYINCGFNFVGTSQPENLDGLPKHYSGNPLALFEIPVMAMTSLNG